MLIIKNFNRLLHNKQYAIPEPLKNELFKKKYNFVEIFKQNKHSTLYLANNDYIIKKTFINDINLENNILKKLNNNNIIKVIDNYNDDYSNYIVMDYHKNGDLFDNLSDKKIDFDKKQINKEFLLKLINPIVYIHNKNIVHLDLKLENYLVTNTNNFLLCDFHLSKYHKDDYNTNYTIDYVAGTKSYIAPEIYEGYFNKKSDVYSFGCILYLLYTNTNFRSEIKYELLKNCPNLIVHILEQTLKDNPNHRLTIYDIKELLEDN